MPALLLLLVVGCSKDDSNLTGPIANDQQQKVVQTSPKSYWEPWSDPEWAKMEPYVKSYPAPMKKSALKRITETPLIVTNGDFETGDFAGWTPFVTFPGMVDRRVSRAVPHPEWAWIVGTSDPFGTNTVIYSPPQMLHPEPLGHAGVGASAVQNVAAVHRLYQTVILPSTGKLTLEFWIRWKSQYPPFPPFQWKDSFQDIIVSLRDPITDARLPNGVLFKASALNLPFFSGGGDISTANYEKRTADVTAFAGQTVRLDFEMDGLGYALFVDLDDIQVVVETALTISAPPDVTEYTGPNATECGTGISDARLGTATTTPAGATITRSGVPPGNFFPVGQTTITYTATDAKGNTAVATQTVTVIDNTPPTITAPPAVTAYTGPSATTCETVVNDLGTATANDNCPGVAVSRAPVGNLFPVGTTTVTYTAADAHGNMATATQTVTVIDNTPPTITEPAAVIAYTGPSATTCETVLTDAILGATANDNCPGVTVTRVPAGDLFPVGITQVKYTATDAYGNTATATQMVTVKDNTPPTITLTGKDPMVLECPAMYVERGAMLKDACDPSPTLTIQGTVDGGRLGTYTVTYTATDHAGNTATATRTVVVQDTKAPTLSCSVSTPLLWPRNDKFVNVGLQVDVTDAYDPNPKVRIEVYSDEDSDKEKGKDKEKDKDKDKDKGRDNDKGRGDDKDSPDAEKIGAGTLQLRAECSGKGGGRVYLIVVTATDKSHNTSFSSCTVVVPHSESKKAIADVNAQAAAAKASSGPNGSPLTPYLIGSHR
jgi:hypothetical protein